MKRPWSMVGIDAAGLSLCLLFLGLGVYTAWPGPQTTHGEAKNLAKQIAARKNDLQALRAELEKQKDLGQRARTELSAAGRVPDQTPQEVHLQVLSGLAAQHHMTVLRQLPLPPREYPGLVEQRFAFEVTGTLTDMVGFFQAVETSAGWTDISYLKIDRGKDAEGAKGRCALLTFSAFSAARAPKSRATQEGARHTPAERKQG